MKRILISLALVLTNWSLSAQTITTIAGGLDYPGYEPFMKAGVASGLLPGVGETMALDASGRVCLGGFFLIVRINETTFAIDTLVGNGVSGNSGNGGLAKNAKIEVPLSMTFDSNGNLYFSDGNNNIIRKIDGITGIITAYAGTGVQGQTGDGGLATAARVTIPVGLAMDASDNLYFIDGSSFIPGSSRIRRVDNATKIITLVALGTGTSMTCDNVGNVIIADTNNERILRLAVSTGLFSTVAGTGIQGFSGDGGLATAAMISKPAGIQFDTGGNLLFIDQGNSRLRRIDGTTQVITTIGGTGLPAYPGTDNGDGGPVAQARVGTFPGDGNLRIASNGSTYMRNGGRIRKIDNTGIIRILVGGRSFFGEGIIGTSSLLAAPSGLCVYQGSLYIADQASTRIRKVDLSSEIITTVAGNGKSGSAGDGGPALAANLANPFQVKPDPEGNLFIVDFGNHAIRRIDKTTGNISTIAGTLGISGFSGDGGLATNAKLFQPSAIAFDMGGNLVIADRFNNRIRRVDRVTNIIMTIAGSGTAGFSGDGGPAISAQFNTVSHLAYDSKWNLYVSDRLNHRIRKIEATTGIVTTVMGNGSTLYDQDGLEALSAGLNWPYGIAFDSQDNMIVADAANNRILLVQATSRIVTTIAGTGVKGFDGDGGPSIDAKLNFPRDLIVNNDEEIYIVDSENNRLRVIEGYEVQITALGDEKHPGPPILYPQPASGVVNIRIPQCSSTIACNVELVDVAGRPIHVPFNQTSEGIQLNIHGLAAGVYVARVTQGPQNWTFRIVTN